jgi:hypothetical protein
MQSSGVQDAHQEQSHFHSYWWSGRGCTRMVYCQRQWYWHNLTGVRNVIFTSQIIIDNKGEIERSQKRHLCEPKRDRQTRLEAVAGTDNPYSLIAISSRGHLAFKAGRAVYVTRCSPVKVVPRHRNCTE